MYSSVHGMECISVRIGNFNPERDRPEHPHHLSHGDCVRLFEAAVCHEDVTCEIVFGVSDSDWALYDVDHGRSVIGYDPQDVSHVAAIDRTFDRSEPAEPLGEAPPERVLITGAAGRVGRVLAAGLRERFEIRGFDQVEMPDLMDQVRQGQLIGLRQWLKKKIHQRGKRSTAGELVEEVTGELLRVDFLMEYLEGKFGELYDI